MENYITIIPIIMFIVIVPVIVIRGPINIVNFTTVFIEDCV